MNRSSSRWNLRTCLLQMEATPLKKCVFTYFIQQAIAHSKLDYLTHWERHRVRSLFCWKKKCIVFFFTSIRMSLHVLVRFQHYFFFNAICGLLTKRANINTHQALAIFRVTFLWMPITGTQYARREVWTRVQARISSCTLLQSEHTRD